MKLFPDRTLVCLMSGLAVAALGLLVWSWWWWLLLVGMLVMALAVWRDYRQVRTYADRVTVMLQTPGAVQLNEPMPVTLTLIGSGHDVLHVTVRVVMPAQGTPADWQLATVLHPPSETQAVQVVHTPVRGTYAFEGVYLRLASTWRLVQQQVFVDVTSTCRVLPDVRRVKEMLISRHTRNIGEPLVRLAVLRGLGSDFESLRDYELGDDVRRIDWRATARHKRLIVRNYEIEPDRNVMILVDRGRLMGARAGKVTKLDHAVDAALMLSAAALDTGDRCGLLVFDKNVAAYNPPRASLAQLPRLVDTLTDVQPTIDETHFQRAFAHLQSRLRKRSLLVMLTDVADADVSRNMIRAVASLNRRHLVVVVAVRTPEIHDVIALPTTETATPFLKTASYRLRRARLETIALLRRAGAFVLDLDPQAITVPLLNQYIEIRERNRL